MIFHAIILNYKAKDQTLKCIDSLKSCSLPSELKLNIIVVDNGSSDGIERAITTHHPDIHFIQTGANLGYTGGNNSAINYVLENSKNQDQEYILILNNDIYFANQFITELAQGSIRHPKAGILSPKIYFAPDTLPVMIKDKDNQSVDLQKNQNVIWYAGGEFDWDNIIASNHGIDYIDQGQFEIEKIIDSCTGCVMLIPVHIFQKVKGFDDNFFMYYEDLDLCLRIKKLGYELWYLPQAIIWHYNSLSSGGGSPLHEYFMMRNRLLIAFKYAKIRTKLAVLREGFRMRNNTYRWLAVKDFLKLKFGKGSFIK